MPVVYLDTEAFSRILNYAERLGTSVGAAATAAVNDWMDAVGDPAIAALTNGTSECLNGAPKLCIVYRKSG